MAQPNFVDHHQKRIPVHDYRRFHHPRDVLLGRSALASTAVHYGCNPSGWVIYPRRGHRRRGHLRRQGLRDHRHSARPPKTSDETLTCLWKDRFGESVVPVEMLGAFVEGGEFGGIPHRASYTLGLSHWFRSLLSVLLRQHP